VYALAPAQRVVGADRTAETPNQGRAADDDALSRRETRKRMGAVGAKIDRALVCPTCHGRRSIPKPRKRDARGVLQVENPPDMVCPDCKGEGVNSSDELLPLLRAYCLKLDDCRRQERGSLLAQNPTLVNQLLRRIRWAQTALRFNQQWESTRAETDEPEVGRAFLLSVEVMRSCRAASGDFELVQARVLFARDAKDADTVYLLFPSRCPSEVEARFRQNRFSRMMVLAYDVGPAARANLRLEFGADAEADREETVRLSADTGLMASFGEAASGQQAARRVLAVAGSRVIRPGSLKSVTTPARTIYRPPARACPEYG